MPEDTGSINPNYEITLDGTDVAGDDSDIVRIRVILTHDGPSQAEVDFWIKTQEEYAWPAAGWALGSEIEIKFAPVGGGDEKVSVFKGLITRVDGDFVGEGGDAAPRGRVIAYCPLHKLARVQKTMHWESSMYSDAADALAGEVGLSTGATGTKISFDYLSVNSQNWLAFLTELARRTGGRLSYEEDKLVFAEADTSNNVGTLTFGQNLMKAKFKADTAALKNEVKVLAYNDKDKAQIIGVATDSDVTKFGGKEVGAAIVSGKYCESPLWITDYAARDQAEVDEVAKAVINELASGFCSVEGATEGDPAIKAGAAITIEGVTPNFAGDYYLTRVVHSWRAEVEAGQAGNFRTLFSGSRNAWSPG